MHVVYWGGRNSDPSFNESAMLHPLTHYRPQSSSLAQYESSRDADQAGRHDTRALRTQPHRAQRNQNQGKKAPDNGLVKAKSPLAILKADQASLRQRKLNIARFGSTWLRPAGVFKTYQAMTDEAAEREEHETQMRREAAAVEEQRAAREAEAAIAAAAVAAAGGPAATPVARRLPGTGAGEFGGEGAMDVDLDDEVPEAEEVEYDEEEEDDDDDEDEEEEEEAQEHDLDDSIPEAGSYQHTDTDVEDEDSINLSIAEHLARNPHAESGVPPENALHPPRILDGATGRFVHSIEGTSEFMPVESPEN